METALFLYGLAVWGALVVGAILNAIVRNALFAPKLGEQAGHVISTFTLVGVIFAITYLFLSNIQSALKTADLLIIGTAWLVLTILFEFMFGHFVMGHPWEKLFADYNVLRGRIWILVLVATFSAPVLMGAAVRK